MTLRVHPDEIVRASTSALLATHPSWERVRLAEVAVVLNGFAFKSQYFGRDGEMPLLRIRDVGKSDTNTCYSGEYDRAYVVEPGSIVVGMDGEFRVALWSGRPALLNQRVCKITVRNSGLYEPRFLFHALPGYLNAVNAHTSSITVKHLSSRTVQDIPLPLPPLNEQRRIVAAIEEHLSRLDAADASLAAALRRLGPLQRHARSDAVARGELRAVGELLDGIEAGKSFQCHGRPANGDEWGVIKVSAMTWGSFDQDENKAVISEERVDPRWEIRDGDLLLSRANTTELVGATVLVSSTRPRLLLSDKSMRLRVRDGIDKAWLQLALSAPESRGQMSAVATGTKDSMRNISQDKVKAVLVSVPPLDEQRRIVAEIEQRLSAIDALRAATERAQRRSAALRRAVLERAFRGELVTQDTSDEPASELLARIRSKPA